MWKLHIQHWTLIKLIEVKLNSHAIFFSHFAYDHIIFEYKMLLMNKNLKFHQSQYYYFSNDPSTQPNNCWNDYFSPVALDLCNNILSFVASTLPGSIVFVYSHGVHNDGFPLYYINYKNTAIEYLVHHLPPH